ncbi:MAG: transketolase C-terminal domain-containing protein, partial [Dehalococcoidia bacterium]
LERGAQWQRDWDRRFEAYSRAFPDESATLRRAITGELPSGWDQALPSFSAADKPMATRAASGNVLNAIADALPLLVGGSADLAESNGTLLKDKPNMTVDEPGGRNVYYGVREHAMGGALNGMAAHGGVIPYGGTFLVFSDYNRPAIRIAALSEFRSIFVFTHDSVGLGEDGPTHQPIEHLMALRAMPHLQVLRPGDANETAYAWKAAIEHRGPSALALSRQALPVLQATTNGRAQGVLRGAYVLSDAPEGRIDAIIIATGSELSVAVEAQALLGEQGVHARVVSMPCWELFEKQDEAYRNDVLPAGVRARVSVEAGETLGWQRWVGDDGDIIGIHNRFGASAPGATVLK